MSCQSLALTEPVVKDSSAEANNCLRRLGAVSRSWRPCDRDAGCKVEMTSRVALYFIAQTVADCEVRLQPPVVLNVRLDIKLADACLRVAGVDGKLRCPSALRANFRRRET